MVADVVADPLDRPLALERVRVLDVHRGQPREQLERRKRHVQVGLPGGDQPVANQVGGADEQGVATVCFRVL